MEAYLYLELFKSTQPVSSIFDNERNLLNTYRSVFVLFISIIKLIIYLFLKLIF